MNYEQYKYGRQDHSAFRTNDYIFHQLIPYIGNKRKLLGLIVKALNKTKISPGSTFLDLFAGSGVVSRMAKKHGYRVISNDWEPYAQRINQCYIEANQEPAFQYWGSYEAAIRKLNELLPVEDWITKHLCPANDDHYDIQKERLFYTHSNGMLIDAMRLQVQRWQNEGLLTDLEMSCLLAPMLYQACYTSNTSGVFKGFHNGWGGQTKTALYRILSPFELKPAIFHDNFQQNIVYKMDCLELARILREDNEVIDIAYLDPPYNQHPYGSNYHVLNTITLWDKPPLTEQIHGRNKAAIREDWRTLRRSPYNHRGNATGAFEELIQTLNAKYILTSYSTDGTIPLLALISACVKRGQTDFVLQQYKRYRVSSQRFSHKPVNLEFILIIDTQRSHVGPSVEAICDSILHSEEIALSHHPENSLRRVEQQTLFSE